MREGLFNLSRCGGGAWFKLCAGDVFVFFLGGGGGIGDRTLFISCNFKFTV